MSDFGTGAPTPRSTRPSYETSPVATRRKRNNTIARHRPSTVDVLVETRFRRKRLSTAIVRVAAFIGSKSLAVRGVRLLRVEYRLDHGEWRSVPPDETLRILTDSTKRGSKCRKG